MKNGVEFTVVSFGGVITECSSIASRCIGRDLKWLHAELKKGETYSAVELEKPKPLWLQHDDFEGNWDHESNKIGVLIIEAPVKVEITNPTQLPKIKGVKFL